MQYTGYRTGNKKLKDGRFRAFYRAGLGVLLALGAPVGWLALDYFVRGIGPMESITASLDLYLYLTIATMLAFGMLGHYLGSLEGRLAQSGQKIQATKEKIEGVSRTDHLTGLYNGPGFLELVRKWAALHRRNGPGASLIILGFRPTPVPRKRPPSAESMLQLVAESVTRGRRLEDVVGRIGIYEFAIFLPNTPLEGAEFVARRILSDCNQYAAEQKTVSIEFSVGVTSLAKFDDARKFIGRAEAAMHAAKRQHANTPIIVTETGEQTDPTGNVAVG